MSKYLFPICLLVLGFLLGVTISYAGQPGGGGGDCAPVQVCQAGTHCDGALELWEYNMQRDPQGNCTEYGLGRRLGCCGAPDPTPQ